MEHVDTLEHQEISERQAHYSHKLGMHGPKIVKDNAVAREVGLDGLTMQEMVEQLETA